MTLKNEFAAKQIEVQGWADELSYAERVTGVNFFASMLGAAFSGSMLAFLVFLGCKNQCYSDLSKETCPYAMGLILMGLGACAVSIVDAVGVRVWLPLIQPKIFYDLQNTLTIAQQKYDQFERYNASCAHEFDRFSLVGLDYSQTLIFVHDFHRLELETLCNDGVNLTALVLPDIA